MFRGYRCIIIAALFAVTAVSVSHGQATTGSNKVAEKAHGAKNSKQDTAASAGDGRSFNDGKQSSEPDCGTPKECRAEQREKDDLVAQQTAAKAASDQAGLNFWQTIIASIGVMAVIATLIYTHSATRAAVKSVQLITAIEKGMLAMRVGKSYLELKNGSVFFHLTLSNTGRTTVILTESNLQQSNSKEYLEFIPLQIEKHNSVIPPEKYAQTQSLQLHLEINKPMFICGYYKWKNQFESKIYCDHFCCQVTCLNGEFDLIYSVSGWPEDSV